MKERTASLAAMRKRARELTSESALRRLASELESDSRAGARALARRCQRRAAALAGERSRMDGLFRLRRELVAAGAQRVAGVDEVGVGPLAGPVVAAAVVLGEAPELPGLDDSKRLSREDRERLAALIRAQALDLAVAEVGPDEIDRINVVQASLLAMRRAVVALAPAPQHVLVDARTIPDLTMPQTAIVGGDGKDASIAAASIVAKVHRDDIMRGLDARFPDYGFARHKGYGTSEHLAALRRVGPCEVHRRSYAPVSQLSLL
ncbi:MAG: ribonuclease HII [Planctomycetota bacterium]|nr:ribonuclease HII [Planctomycetota bacterium]